MILTSTKVDCICLLSLKPYNLVLIQIRYPNYTIVLILVSHASLHKFEIRRIANL